MYLVGNRDPSKQYTVHASARNRLEEQGRAMGNIYQAIPSKDFELLVLKP
jgi:hypothetical protein